MSLIINTPLEGDPLFKIYKIMFDLFKEKGFSDEICDKRACMFLAALDTPNITGDVISLCSYDLFYSVESILELTLNLNHYNTEFKIPSRDGTFVFNCRNEIETMIIDGIEFGVNAIYEADWYPLGEHSSQCECKDVYGKCYTVINRYNSVGDYRIYFDD